MKYSIYLGNYKLGTTKLEKQMVQWDSSLGLSHLQNQM
ncbi:MAG: hypothetical protein ACI8YQ_000393 [Polaribacter sp.]|jgi:hypothetical protein